MWKKKNLNSDPIPNPSPKREGSAPTQASTVVSAKAMEVLPVYPEKAQPKATAAASAGAVLLPKGGPDSYREEGVLK